MTLSTTGYTVGSNRPLTHARILWNPIAGTVTAGGTDGALAASDYTWQRWKPGALPASWTIVTAADAQIDTVFIAGHNLGSTGTTVVISTAASVGGAHTTRATIVPTDNSAIAAMFNSPTGLLLTVREVRISLTGSSANTEIGIIRAGAALQMRHPSFGGVQPIGLTRLVETRHSLSETGQWLGRTIQRQALRTDLNFDLLEAAWYRANFEPFAKTLPQRPFGLVQNPARMPESVAWCWTDQSPQPSNSGLRDFMEVSLSIVGFDG